MRKKKFFLIAACLTAAMGAMAQGNGRKPCRKGEGKTEEGT